MDSKLNMSAFDDLNGVHYYPQIYIPLYDSNEWDETLPTTIAHCGLDTITFTGYTQDQQGNIDSNQTIDTSACYTQEVWVLSMNENVDEDGDLTEIILPDGSTIESKEEPGDEGSENEDPHVKARIYSMKIKDNKETWFSGASEICFRGHYNEKTVKENWLPGWGYMKSNGIDEKEAGELIRVFSRKDIKKGTTWGVNKYFAYNWQATGCDEGRFFLLYIIFERDWLGAVHFTDYIILNISPLVQKRISWRSKNWFYYWEWLTPVDGCGYSNYVHNLEIDNSTIYFKTKREVQ